MTTFACTLRDRAHSQLAFYRPSSIVYRPSSIVYRPSSIVYRPPSTVHRPPFFGCIGRAGYGTA